MPLPRCTCLLPLFLLAAPVLASPVFYRTDPLPDPPGFSDSTTYGINNRGDVVGAAYGIDTQTPVSFLWPSGSDPIPILPETPGDLTLQAQAFAINNRGDVIGRKIELSGVITGFVRYADGTTQSWSQVPDENGPFQPSGLNDSGVVIGSTHSGTFLFDGTSLTRLNVRDPARPSSSEFGGNRINDRGDIAGGTYTLVPPSPGITQTDLYLLRNNQLTFIPRPFGPMNYIFDLNETGTILGLSGFIVPSEGHTAQEFQPFVWTNGETTLLPTLPDTEYAQGNALNNSGTVIGIAASSDFRQIPVVWQQGIPYDIQTLVDPDTYVYAVADINDAGQIVGYGAHNGLLSAFILTPIPEPTSLLPLLLSPLLLRRR